MTCPSVIEIISEDRPYSVSFDVEEEDIDSQLNIYVVIVDKGLTSANFKKVLSQQIQVVERRYINRHEPKGNNQSKQIKNGR